MSDPTSQELFRRNALQSADLAAALCEAESDQRLFLLPELTAVHIEALEQLWKAHRDDGCVLSKSHRDDLVRMGLASRWNGWNFITTAGVATLETLKGPGGLERALKVAGKR